MAASLNDLLRQAYARAAAAYPGLQLPPSIFTAHVARWLSPDRSPADGVASLHVEELFLTLAAAEGQAEAVTLLDKKYFGRAKAALAQLERARVTDEVLQRVREALFVRTPGRKPKIADYGGRGELERWIRTTAVRTALNMLGKDREHPLSDEAMAGFSKAGDLGVELMKREDGANFKIALNEALAKLPQQTRDELRHYYFEALSAEQISAIYGVSASTVSRRLEKARQLLHDRTRAILAMRLRAKDAELDGILRRIDTQLDASRSALIDQA